LQDVHEERRKLEKLIKENEKLKKEMEQVTNQEKHRQQIELLKNQNVISGEKLLYLRDMERKLKSILIEWKKTDDKEAVINMMQSLLFKQREKHAAEKQQKKIDTKYIETTEPVKEGDKVKMIANRQVGVVIKMRGKKAVVQVGAIPITVDIADLVVIKEKQDIL
jgi:DNA mismatch repair protein MutS2